MAATVQNPAARDPFTDDHALNKDRSPPPPPVPAKSKKMPTTTDNHTDITQAVRDTVTVQGKQDRAPIARSQTHGPDPSSRPAAARRAISNDSANPSPASGEKAKSSKHRSKKGSQHADVIDRLDFTGVGPMFHHDGPFDACAPSRNKHRTKAPMAAWTPQGMISTVDSSPYPAPSTAAATFSYEYETPKRKVDAIAEAWGMHEPEPFEEFSAGGGRHGDTPNSSVYNGRSGHNTTNNNTPSTKKERAEERPRERQRRPVVPPPMPIFVPENDEAADQQLPLPSPPMGSPGGNGPKRSKSLMHRIRRLRDSPNVPMNNGYDGPTSPSDANYAPSHRAKNPSVAVSRNGAEPASPLSDPSDFVYIDDSRRHVNDNGKQLPTTPGTPGSYENGNYFDPPVSPGGTAMGRRTSIIQKVRGVVRGNNK